MTASSSAPSPFFAIVMPAYNAAATIDEALASALAQTFTDWELVVVDDGSTDTTRARAEVFAARDARIRVVAQPNGGVGAARARAIAETGAPYILQLDADDVLLPHCLATYAPVIAATPSRDIFTCDMDLFRGDKELGRYYGAARFPAKPAFDLRDMLGDCVIANPASVISRALYDRVGGVRRDAYAEDYDLWLRALAQGGRHLLIPDALVRYRLSQTQRIAAAERLQLGSAEALRNLIASGLLDPELRRLAQASAVRFEAMACRQRALTLREALEERLRRGDLQRARRDFLCARPAYESRLKLAFAAPAILASPGLYAAYLRKVRGGTEAAAPCGRDAAAVAPCASLATPPLLVLVAVMLGVALLGALLSARRRHISGR